MTSVWLEQPFRDSVALQLWGRTPVSLVLGVVIQHHQLPASAYRQFGDKLVRLPDVPDDNRVPKQRCAFQSLLSFRWTSSNTAVQTKSYRGQRVYSWPNESAADHVCAPPPPDVPESECQGNQAGECCNETWDSRFTPRRHTQVRITTAFVPDTWFVPVCFPFALKISATQSAAPSVIHTGRAIHGRSLGDHARGSRLLASAHRAVRPAGQLLSREPFEHLRTGERYRSEGNA